MKKNRIKYFIMDSLNAQNKSKTNKQQENDHQTFHTCVFKDKVQHFQKNVKDQAFNVCSSA